MAGASSEIQQVLRQSRADLVTHIAERWQEGPDGKPLKFKQPAGSNLAEFLSNFSFRMVTDDRELQDLVSQARGLAAGGRGRGSPNDQRRPGARPTGNGDNRCRSERNGLEDRQPQNNQR